MELNQMDELLNLLLDSMTVNTKTAVRENKLTKDLVEAACIVLSVAYERARSFGK